VINEKLIRGRMPNHLTMECDARKRRAVQSPSSARMTIILGAIAYTASFQWAYSTILSHIYAYEGFRYRHDSAVISATWLLAILPSFWMPTRLRRPSQLAYWFFYLIVVVPVTIVTVHSEPGDAQDGLRTALWIVSAFAALGLTYAVPPAAIPHNRFQPNEWWGALLLFSTISYGLIFFAFGLRLNFVSLSDVYTVRSEYNKILDNTNVYISYAVDWQAYILNPLLIILGLISRRKLVVVMGAIGQLVIYSFTGFRGVFFSTGVLFLLLILCRSFARFGIRMLLSLTAAMAGATALYLWSGSLFLGSLIIERLTGLPGLLTGFYFSFFAHHPKMMLSHSILRSIVGNPYESVPPIIIGNVYFRGADANANFWADAFANFGIWGVFSFTAILAVVFWFYDSITVETDLRLSALMLAMPAFSLANGGLLTCLLMHGLGFACLVMYYLPNQIPAPEPNGALHYAPTRSTRLN
jgi:hypothetical protein